MHFLCTKDTIHTQFFHRFLSPFLYSSAHATISISFFFFFSSKKKAPSLIFATITPSALHHTQNTEESELILRVYVRLFAVRLFQISFFTSSFLEFRSIVRRVALPANENPVRERRGSTLAATIIIDHLSTYPPFSSMLVSVCHADI